MTTAIEDGNSLVVQQKEVGVNEQDWQQWFQSEPQDDNAWINTICSSYDKNFPICVKASGQGRCHKKGYLGDVEWSMSADLSGPHPLAVATEYKYMMITVIRLEKRKEFAVCERIVGKRSWRHRECVEKHIIRVEVNVRRDTANYSIP